MVETFRIETFRFETTNEIYALHSWMVGFDDQSYIDLYSYISPMDAIGNESRVVLLLSQSFVLLIDWV